MKIKDLLENLEKEIEKTKVAESKAAQLTRLKFCFADYNHEDRVISSKEFAEKIKARPDELKILSGWKSLDEILKGFRLTQLITVAAPTKSGKTSWCIDLTTRLKDYAPLWFPFEEGVEELIQKFLDRKETPPHFFTPEQMQPRATSKETKLEWIEAKIIESIVKYGTQVIFIDHLHFIVPFSAERSDLRIGETMRELKQIAKRWGVTIFLIAHLKKTRLDSQPDLEDLRDSSFIAQESDTVIMLWRESKRENGQVVITDNVNLSVQANRRTGKTGNVKMVYKNGKFLEQDWRSQAEVEAEGDKDFLKL